MGRENNSHSKERENDWQHPKRHWVLPLVSNGFTLVTTFIYFWSTSSAKVTCAKPCAHACVRVCVLASCVSVCACACVRAWSCMRRAWVRACAYACVLSLSLSLNSYQQWKTRQMNLMKMDLLDTSIQWLTYTPTKHRNKLGVFFTF